MSVEYEVLKPTDLSRIDTNNLGELLWWSYILDTSPEKIVTIIHNGTNTPDGIRKTLGNTSTAV
jgi:hypothetical protein